MPTWMTTPMLDADDMRRLLARRDTKAANWLRSALHALPSLGRDGWVDSVFGVVAFVPDEQALPRGCVPYLPCSVDVVLRAVDAAGITHCDVVVDVGSGLGRAAALIHLLTGAGAIGIEIQPDLIRRSRALAETLGISRVASVEGDAAELIGLMQTGTVFFLYCPFSGARLERVLDALEELALTRSIRVCCVDLPVIRRSWLELTSPEDGELLVYRTKPSRQTPR